MRNYLKKYKGIWTKFKDLKNIKLEALTTLPVYYDRYIKTEIRTYGNKVYTNFGGLNVQEDDVESESFTVVSIISLLVYLQVYLDIVVIKLKTNK